MKKFKLYFFVVFIIMFGFYLLYSQVFFKNYDEVNKKSLDSRLNFDCSGAIKYERWSWNGLSKKCFKNGSLNGSAFYAEYGTVKVTSHYKNGQLFGAITEFDKNNQVAYKEYYSDGNCVAKEIYKKGVLYTKQEKCAP